MSEALHLGKDFTLPLDAVTRTFAILAIRGAGKTTTAKRMAEEMARCGLPWICFDPVGVWWGIRATPEGKPGGYPVVVIGGQHGDLPLEKGSGQRIAEALIAENVCAVVDLSRETKTFWHTFVTDFSLRLLALSPATPRHLFLEEAPEFVPQRSSVFLTQRCKEAVERLVSLGRNSGYGCTLISQRPATVDKNVLSQCENLFVLRTTGPHDRKALTEWVEGHGLAHEVEPVFRMADLAVLPNGTAWFWSPEWLNQFVKVQITPSMTYHPGATRQVGKAIQSVELADVAGFVAKLTRQLNKASVTMPPPATTSKTTRAFPSKDTPIADMISTDSWDARDEEIVTLQTNLDDALRRAHEAERRLDVVKKLLQPQYDGFKTVFEAAGTANGTAVDAGVYAPWLAKAGRAGCRRLLEVVIQRRQLTRTQLATLAGLGPNTGTFRNYLSWLRRNGIVRTEGESVILNALP